MKPVKTGLRIWIAVTSILSFLAGWALLSHANKPVSLFSSLTSNPTASLTVATLQPVPSLDSLTTTGSSVQPLPAQPQSNLNTRSNMPRLRTRGS